MEDLTKGSISRHLLKTTSFMLVTMVFQTLYFLIDLYWVGRLGKEALAGVGIAGNLMFVVLAVTQMLGVGTTTLISHASGRKDREQAQVVFNQSVVLSAVITILFLAVAQLARRPYVNAFAADAVTAARANDYLRVFNFAMALQFPLVVMGAALRGTGNFKPGMIIGTASLILNMSLAPFLMFGWLTGHPLGVAGTAYASLAAVIMGTAGFALYFLPTTSFLRLPDDFRPRPHTWWAVLKIGLPAGAEFALTTVYLLIVYAVSRPFGASAQAGFGIGLRVVQAGFMPVVALGFSVAPVAGQNFGARQGERVVRAFRDAALMAAGVMVAFGVLCYLAPESLIRFFSADPGVIAVGTQYLRIICWNFVASGVLFVNASMFQAVGNTIPSLVASFARTLLFGLAVWVAVGLSGFELGWIWYISVVAVWLQLGLNLMLLRREFRKRLHFDSIPVAATA